MTMNLTEWEEKEEGNEVTQQWEDDWDDDDVNDDFSLQLRRELENNAEKNWAELSNLSLLCVISSYSVVTWRWRVSNLLYAKELVNY